MLEIANAQVKYGEAVAVRGASLTVNEGECIGLLGPNGAGKTTLLNAISGLVRVSSGSIRFLGEEIGNAPAHRTQRKGISQVPEGRKIFPSLSVTENALIGAYTRSDAASVKKELAEYTEMFPRIFKERGKNRGENLSGGEQQIVAIVRALMSRPKLLLLDEPSLGLAPLFIESVYELIGKLHARGNSILLVEQNAAVALEVCSRVYIIEAGVIVASGTPQEVAASDEIRSAYLGL